ncbi:bifunctional 3-(3-hydroxy-phenyl)propionate/3-hydroxycinnamic acid hydroxylase [Kaistia dalseonensis]|uniref:3-(3-hydroxy-phenyl)propionate hydroxylase n=1 Tax=Kaistia dalseonensis TaxID=410840 RepID=A0ABU0H746_9HYPH|nr:bifunctional 3-(3-hydroxy-phenyl)propionate/3-hydroxycinnamic acid hydroxylase [Kaistia dalseonensis]MCX5495531.1 bifunctional 3-(3-hydroxy-phenyl)propionate/3-hydroxycinnamic acid hydroxylase [Kaistia dalseonensis]MDQ0438123.1 3-(3-hydroxy-phenyl)propionate hydroxylase [Kaistia dalseonensis]
MSTTSHDADHWTGLAEPDAVIVGAGPVGLLIANQLGAQGLSVLVLEQLPELIDYPRGVGMDDECLRAIQAVGLVDGVLPHTTPNQWMRFVTGKGRCFASIEPRTDEFGWPRRNAFIQPLVDRVLADGLSRYPGVSLELGTRLDSFTQDNEGVTLKVVDRTGTTQTIRTRYMVAADGGKSAIRKALDIPFEGTTDSNRWIVIDVANDPVASPNAYMHCDPARPYVSIALPHGIRRFEFMLFAGEAPGDVVPPEMLRQMLAKVVADPDNIDLIRARIYTHNARLAKHFRKGRVLLAGDAAHIMPVWQGQGYNSGVRDAANLGWKLALVLKGIAGDELLDTYEEERREHARAMIDLSQTAGRIFSPTNPIVVGLRDAITWLLNYIPPVKRYFLEMRFKPMPRYKSGALFYGHGFDAASPVGRMFIQPMVETADRRVVRLDDIIGNGFALIAWGIDPSRWLSPATRRTLDRLGARIISVVPSVQLQHEHARYNDVTVVGDRDGRLKEWFGRNADPVILVRPDRFVGAACKPQSIDDGVVALTRAMSCHVEAIA